jgi:tryptophanyl-tRNA synthetase
LSAIGGKQKRVVSGMRPTGRLHIGHYFGALHNWVRLQNDPEYDCFYFIADWHALTSDYADSSQVTKNTIEIVTDYLAAGLDPEKSVIFQQSLVPEHAELNLLLSMVTPLSWLERIPTYKEAFENVTHKDLHTYGFLGYPCLQTADIVIYSKVGTTLFVPVGEDQVSHVELSREIVRRFNTFYGLQIDRDRWEKEGGIQSLIYAVRSGSNIALEGLRRQALEDGIHNWLERIGELGRRFVKFTEHLCEPGVLLTRTPRVPGLDGRKMSKSYGNAITLSESDDDIHKKTKTMVTDPARQRRTDPGNPDICPVYDWHKLFSPEETLDWAAHGCRTAGIGCIECKSKMANHLIEWIDEKGIRERRLYFEKRESEVRDIVQEGSVKARIVAQETMSEVRDAVFGKQRIKRRTIRPNS